MKIDRRSSLREEILQVATELFYEFGYEKASMREISRRLGVTQAALYYHFKNKEELLFKIIEDSSNRIYFLISSLLKQKKDPLGNLKEAIAAHIFEIKKHRHEAKIIIEDKRSLAPNIKKFVRKKEKALFYLYKDHIKDLQKKKVIQSCNLNVITFTILGTINWLYHWYNPDGALSIEDIAKDCISVLFDGIEDRRFIRPKKKS